jgi:hypothetical protein
MNQDRTDVHFGLLEHAVAKLKVINDARHRIVSMEIEDEDGYLNVVFNDATDTIIAELQEHLSTVQAAKKVAASPTEEAKRARRDLRRERRDWLRRQLDGLGGPETPPGPETKPGPETPPGPEKPS